MSMRLISALGGVALMACTTPVERQLPSLCDPELAPTSGIASGTALVLTTALDYSSSSLDAVELSAPDQLQRERLVAAGDAALRRLGAQGVVINRGNASNLILVDASLYPTTQLSVGECNPHDVELLSDCRGIVTCYDDDKPRIIDFATGELSDGPSLAAFADADALPEMDQIARVGDRLYITLQRLDRGAFYEPAGAGLIVVLDAETLTLVDADPSTPEVDAYALPCRNPMTDLYPVADDGLVLACSGSFIAPGHAAIIRFDIETGESEILVDETTLEGHPAALRVGEDGTAYAIVSVPWGDAADHMSLMAYASDGRRELLQRPGYSLGGLALDGDSVWVGDRSTGSDAGLWRIDIDSAEAHGPYSTSLPPSEIEIF